MGAPTNHLLSAARFLALSGLLWLVACAPPRAVLVERGPQAHYQTAYPIHDTSGDLAQLFRSVKQVVFTAQYRTYEFGHDKGMTEADVRAVGYQARADSAYPETVSKSGTATVITRAHNRITLLTTQHLVHFPEVRVQYWDEPSGVPRPAGGRRVASVSVKMSERGILVPQAGSSALRVTARDEQHDLALLNATIEALGDTIHFPAMQLAAGDARRLSWGSFVYVIGYPRSTPMVTRAIVSNPDRDGRGGFVTDGLWNEGISGGLILGVRGDTGDLEVVGMARAGVGEREVQIRPDTTQILDDLDVVRYEGPLYLQTALRIRYGITLPVSMTTISEFLRQNRITLRTGQAP